MGTGTAAGSRPNVTARTGGCLPSDVCDVYGVHGLYDVREAAVGPFGPRVRDLRRAYFR